ncbi:tRNA(His) guanylyltransferase Thg1 family protein [Methanoregula sp.]|uniref:tRNA(His) guanylyltransferase Thg1 family protein n=1 Tax=Methanoregula sp. TaxID=2052170 RepID=UPI00356B1DE8
MENREIFSNLATISPVFVRLDGRAFHGLTRKFGFVKPFDDRFNNAMVEVCRLLVGESGLTPVFAYTFSDEISLYLTELPFSGRVEKIDSVAASYAASALTLALDAKAPLAFDARIVQATPESAIEYITGRQDEAWRDHLNAYCQQALISEGMDGTDAARKLKGMPAQELHEMMHKRGVNLAKTPAWQRRGVLVCKKEIEKEGYNPITKEHVTVTRSMVVTDRDLPLFTTPEGQAFLKKLIGGTGGP